MKNLNYFWIALFVLLTACTKPEGTNPSRITSSTSSTQAECSTAKGFNSMAECRELTQSQCTPASGNFGTCYFPAQNWQTCAGGLTHWEPSPWRACLIREDEKTQTVRFSRTVSCIQPQPQCFCTHPIPTSQTLCSYEKESKKPLEENSTDCPNIYAPEKPLEKSIPNCSALAP